MTAHEQATIDEALRDLRQLLRHHQALGIVEYPLTDDVRHFLEVTAPSFLRNRSNGAGISTAAQAIAIVQEEPGPCPDVLESLPPEIRQCTLCRLAAVSPCRVPGRGRAGSRLLVVGDWSVQGQECNPALLFGEEEDAMLWKMMEAIALSPAEVYVTNILKCSPGKVDVDQVCRQSCFSYLIREIAAVRPQLICAMGELAAAMLVASSEPLYRLRGRFSMYRYQDSEQIPVMPTFHPRYLLHNPEMKMATWKDLQAIRRRLERSGNSTTT